jgi:uncharacterized membrane protein YsdA (DUF1294 family)
MSTSLHLPASPTLVLVILAAYVCGSAITFATFGFDKRCAVLKKRRVPERTLHGLTFAFGFPGAILAMLAFRHKTRKPAFFVVTMLVVVTHLVLVGVVLRCTSSATP